MCQANVPIMSSTRPPNSPRLLGPAAVMSPCLATGTSKRRRAADETLADVPLPKADLVLRQQRSNLPALVLAAQKTSVATTLHWEAVAR